MFPLLCLWNFVCLSQTWFLVLLPRHCFVKKTMGKGRPSNCCSMKEATALGTLQLTCGKEIYVRMYSLQSPNQAMSATSMNWVYIFRNSCSKHVEVKLLPLSLSSFTHSFHKALSLLAKSLSILARPQAS